MHILMGVTQPATEFDIDVEGIVHTLRLAPDEPIWCRCCGCRRPASDAVVQVFYDDIRAYCADGRGCKDVRLIAAKKAAQFARRSAGQKRRWAK